MNKVQALEWLVKSVVKWPNKNGGIVSSPKGWLFGTFQDGSVQLYKKEPTEMYADCHVAEQEWLNWEFISCGKYAPKKIITNTDTIANIDKKIKINAFIGKKIKIYIAGPMTGYDNFNRDVFNVAETILIEKGYIVLNPATLPEGLSQKEYMQICLQMVMCADRIYMLKGWRESKGALAELYLAEKLELNVVEE